MIVTEKWPSIDNCGKIQIIIESVGWIYDNLLHYSFYFGVFQNFPNENIKKLKGILFRNSFACLKRTLAKRRHPGKMEPYHIVILIHVSFMTMMNIFISVFYAFVYLLL